MNSRYITIILLFSSIIALGQQYTISGYIQDNESGENLIGVSIYDQQTYKGTASNQYGFYSLSMQEGEYTIIYSFIGYKSITKRIILNKDLRLNIELVSDAILTEEVI